MREIEIKLKVNNVEMLEKKLKEKGCVLSAPLHQHDVIYSKNGDKEFESAKEGDVILRIRQENDRVEFNLKKQKSNEMDNLEYETEIKDRKAMDNILRTLGWFPEIEVKKIRRKGKLAECEICLDQVEELGDFMELEKLTEETADPEKIRDELFTVAQSLGLSRNDEEVRGYDTQIYQIRKKEIS